MHYHKKKSNEKNTGGACIHLILKTSLPSWSMAYPLQLARLHDMSSLQENVEVEIGKR